MKRIKSTTDKRITLPPETITLTSEQRITFIANLIVDQISSDIANKQKLLKTKIGKSL